MTNPLEDPRTFRSLAKTHAKEIRLLKDIVWRWRRYSAFVPGVDGYWAAHPLPQWREWNGNPARRTFDRWLKTLEDFGLIERERHRYSGNTICSFIRPTVLALKHLGDDADLARLKVKTPTRKKAKTGAPHGATIGASHGATLGASDHTSFPSCSSYSSTPKNSHAHTHTGGKGSAGEDGKVKKKKLILKKPVPKAPIAPPPDDDDVDAMIAAAKAGKRAKLLELFPVIPDAVKTVHPSHPKMWGDEWFKFSPKAQAVTHAKYKSYAENELAAKGKHGKSAGSRKPRRNGRTRTKPNFRTPWQRTTLG